MTETEKYFQENGTKMFEIYLGDEAMFVRTVEFCDLWKLPYPPSIEAILAMAED